MNDDVLCDANTLVKTHYKSYKDSVQKRVTVDREKKKEHIRTALTKINSAILKRFKDGYSHEVISFHDEEFFPFSYGIILSIRLELIKNLEDKGFKVEILYGDSFYEKIQISWEDALDAQIPYLEPSNP